MEKRRTRRILVAFLSVVLSAGLLIWSLRGVHWVEVARLVAQANIPYLVFAALIASGGLVARAIRCASCLAPTAL